MHLKVSTHLQNGKYRVESVLGQGGFGITYLAVQKGLDRKVAVKEFFMKEHCERDKETSQVSLGTSGSRELVKRFKEKFLREAKTIASLNHPNIVRIYDIFEENGTAYYVMEYHGMGSLSSLDLPLPVEKAVSYIKQISSALSYLHERNIMHLDVKPSNILLDENGCAVLIDFGVSKRYDDAGHQTSSTPVGISHGYAPIEQYSQGVKQFSPPTDIYALGATMYKLLTGVTPPEASVLVSAPNSLTFPSTISDSHSAAIRKCMQQAAGERPQSVEAFVEMIQGQQDNPSVRADGTELLVEAEEHNLSDHDFVAKYNRLLLIQEYEEAYILCLDNAKTSSEARRLLPEALDRIVNKVAAYKVSDNITYDWIIDQLQNSGCSKMARKGDALVACGLKFRIQDTGENKAVEITKTLRDFYHPIILLALCVSSVYGLSFNINCCSLLFPTADSWGDMYEYEQLFGMSDTMPDPLAIVSVIVIPLVLAFLWIRFVRKLKARKKLRRQVINALVDEYLK